MDGHAGNRKSKDMKITEERAGLLRWALVEAAWRLVGNSPKSEFECASLSRQFFGIIRFGIDRPDR